MKLTGLFLALFIIAVSGSFLGWASPPNKDPVAIANDLLDQLETAYETKNISLITSLYNDPIILVDITRNQHQLCLKDQLQLELKESIGPLSEITVEFTELEITSKKETILVHTFRIAGAKELSFLAKVELLLIMKPSFTQKRLKNYVITDQILLSEDKIPTAID